MRLFFSISSFLLLSLVPVVTDAQDSASADEAGTNWTSLFDGKTLEGWTQRGGKAVYEVKDGTIVGSTVPGTPNSFLCTDKDYGDFELELEFKVHPELNSGIQIRSNSNPEYKNGRVHGYQVEIDPSFRSWSCGIYDEGRSGWLFELKDNVAARYAFKQNDWNHYRVVAVGDSIQTWINGVHASQLTDDKTATGFIALQVHGVGGRKDPIDVSWRNIRIREAKEPVAIENLATSRPDTLVTSDVTKLSDGFVFVEGPALGADGRIYFSDIPKQTINVFDPVTEQTTIYREDSGGANGLVWTPNDFLVACEGSARRVSLQGLDGKCNTIVDSFDGKKLNSPNDITLDGVGGFYFTDPRYGNRDNMEMKVEGVYYVNRGRKISRVIDDIERPNGIELSPDGKTLYVADTGSGAVFACDVTGPGKLANRRLFVQKGSDGMTIDSDGNLYITNGNAVHCYQPNGEVLAKIEFPENPSNVTFGGPEMKTLFVTARSGFYKVKVNRTGGRAFANSK